MEVIAKLSAHNDSDAAAVMRHAFEKDRLDPDVVRRIEERASRITDRLRQTYGVIDDECFQSLLSDDEA